MLQWGLEFQAVECARDNKDVDPTVIELKEEASFLSKAELFRTPAKRKRDTDEEDNARKEWEGLAGTFEPVFPKTSPEMDKLVEGGLKDGMMSSAIFGLERIVPTMGEGMEELAVMTYQRLVKLEGSVEVFSDIAQTLRTRVGNVVEVNDKFIAPTLWGSTSCILDEVVRIIDNVDTLLSEFTPLKSMLEEVVAKVEESGEGKYALDQIVGIVTKMMKRIKEMVPEIAQLKHDVSVLVKRLPQSPSASTTPPPASTSTVDDLMRIMGSSGLQDGSDRISPANAMSPPSSGEDGGEEFSSGKMTFLL